MSSLVTKIRSFIREEEGLTTVEYAIAGGLVGLVVIAAFDTLGFEVGRIITAIANLLTAVQP